MRPLLFSALLLLSGHAQASEWNDSQAVDKLFGAAGVKGTFVLYDVQRQRYVGHDRGARKPASFPLPPTRWRTA